VFHAQLYIRSDIDFAKWDPYKWAQTEAAERLRRFHAHGFSLAGFFRKVSDSRRAGKSLRGLSQEI
jgi:hypothetical protein